jgi:hypothetical protein
MGDSAILRSTLPIKMLDMLCGYVSLKGILATPDGKQKNTRSPPTIGRQVACECPACPPGWPITCPLTRFAEKHCIPPNRPLMTAIVEKSSVQLHSVTLDCILIEFDAKTDARGNGQFPIAKQ